MSKSWPARRWEINEGKQQHQQKKRKVNQTKCNERKRETKERQIQTSWDVCLVVDDEDRMWGPTTGNVEFDDNVDCIDDIDGDDADGIVSTMDGAGDGVSEGEGESSSARVPDPRRYSLPRHLTVDEPVNALK